MEAILCIKKRAMSQYRNDYQSRPQGVYTEELV